jgi:hypothetical protein
MPKLRKSPLYSGKHPGIIIVIFADNLSMNDYGRKLTA